MSETEVRIDRADTWERLQQLLHDETPDAGPDRPRSTEIFRGQTNRDYSLTTSLQRFVGESDEWHLETQLLRNFNKYAQQYIDEPPSAHHLVSLAQHHGLPTRLLDWSYSPLVATYFATGGSPGNDGEVLVVDHAAAHRHLPPVLRSVLDRAATDMLDIDLMQAAEAAVIREMGADAVGASSASRSLEAVKLREVIAEFRDRQPEPYATFFEPPPIDQRIANQSALFAGWFPADPRRPMDDWLTEHPEFFRRVVIPGGRKREYRAKLDRSNVNQRTLFPGLDGLATWLQERYNPAPRDG